MNRPWLSAMFGLLIDQQLLELEGHLPLYKKRVESRAVDRVEEEKVERWGNVAGPLKNLWTLNALLLYFLVSTLYFFGLKAKKIGATGFEPATS